MTLLDKFVKSYDNTRYEYTVLVRHQGVLMSFAMASDRRIYYTVLDLQNSESAKKDANQSSKKKSTLDVESWPETPSRLPFPREITQVGYAATNQVVISRPETAPDGETAKDDEFTGDAVKDNQKFAQTTARFTAKAPFQVVSDGDNLYLFRQAIASDDPNNFKVKVTANAQTRDVSIVDRTLLCDRYVLVGKALRLKQEVRYQRSRSRTNPQSDKDSLSNVDLDGNKFYEPTQELGFVKALTGGWFTVLLLPTQVADQKQWQLFAYNDNDKTIDFFNLEQSATGWFNLAQKPSLPAYNPPSEYALKFDGTGYVALGDPSQWTLDFTQGLTIEAWVLCDRIGNWTRVIELSNGASSDNIFLVNVEGSTTLRFGIYLGSPASRQYVEVRNVFETGKWMHVAAIVDAQGNVSIYKNGERQPMSAFLAKDTETPQADPTQATFVLPPTIVRSQNYLGKSVWPNNDLFAGSLDEVRLWATGRTEQDIKTNRLARLQGNEAGLIGYWRCNEGTGTQVYDTTNSNVHGQLVGGMSWIPATLTRSNIPQSKPITPDQLGVQPDVKLSLRDRTIVAGLSAVLYYQQESATTGYDQQAKPLKQSARVMLATATRQGTNSNNSNNSYVTLLDFGVSRQGKLAKIPPQLTIDSLTPETTPSTTQAALESSYQATASLMPLITVDSDGLTIAGGIADFAWTKSTPQLFDSATGQLTLYFQGADDQFFAAYYQTLTARATFYLTAAGANPPIVVACMARSADAAMDQIRLSLTQVQGDRCTLQITGPNGITETWNNLPRDPRAFATTLTGQTNEPVYLGKLKDPIVPRSTMTTLALDECRVESLTPYGVLQIDDLQLGVGTASQIGVTIAPINPARFQRKFDRGTPVYWVNGNDLELVGSLATEVPVDQSMTELQIASSKSARSLPANAMLKFSPNGAESVTLKEELELGVSQIAIDAILFPKFIAAGSLVYYLPYNYTKQAQTNVADVDLSRGSRLLVARDTATSESSLMSGTLINPGMLTTPEQDRDRRWVTAVQDASAQRTPNNRWIPANTGGAIALNGSESLTLKEIKQLKQLSLPSSFTIETWLKPNTAIESQILTFVADAANTRDQDPCSYVMGTLPEATGKAYELQPSSDLRNRFYMKVAHQIDFTQGFTIEAWVNFKAFGGILQIEGKYTRLIGKDNRGQDFFDVAPCKLCFGIESSGRLGVLGEGQYVGSEIKAFATSAAVKLNTWTHLVVSISPQGQIQLYRDGEALASETYPIQSSLPNLSSVQWERGQLGYTDYQGGMLGGVDDIRIWQRGRSQQEIQANLDRRLLGSEARLLHYWYATSADIDRKLLPDRVVGSLYAEGGYANQQFGVMDSRFAKKYFLSFGVNGRSLKSVQSFLPSEWTHFAATFEQAYGVQFNGSNTFLNAGNDTSLDLQQDLTIEVFVYLTDLKQGCGLLSKGSFSQRNTEEKTYDPSYALWITPDGQLAFGFKEADSGQSYSFTSEVSSRVEVGKFYRIGLTRYCASKVIEIKKDDGMLADVKVEQYTEITFYLNGKACGSSKIKDKQVRAGRNNQPLTIGKADIDSGSVLSCNGIISQVRLWNTVRSATDITQPVNSGGLAAWWKFADGIGAKQVTDAQGTSHAKLSQGCEWVKTKDDAASPIRLYANGELLAVESATIALPQTNQFTLGSKFNGTIEETRLWKTVRTQEQILDNVFRQLMGEQDDLLAYYPYSLEAGDILDDSGNGLGLAIVSPTPNTVRQPSDAPISLDAPQVRNALGGTRTMFNQSIHSSPTVHEYADVQYTSSGEMVGIFKRCYSYIKNNQWQLITGFKVGDLSTEWIGQIQFAPQIIGFIEGAPPVPSENLTRQDSYNEASSIELQAAQNTIYTYDSSFAGSFLLNSELKVQSGLDVEVGFGKGAAAAAFIEVENKLAKVKAVSGMKVTSETDIGGSQAYTRSKAKRISQLSKMSLQGTRENEGSLSSEALGRRFIPRNVGFALVQSETGDVFALRLKHKDPAKRVLISYQVMPNPDIPKDWNIINFPINPRYTKQGTLDGKVGLSSDIAYPNAAGYSSDRSYFKPQEAYAIKREIDKQDQRLRALYGVSRTLNMDWINFGKSNLVNTYVWTADGGLFTESTDTLEVYRENFATSTSFKLMSGSTMTVDATLVMANASLDFSLMAGFQIKYTESKTRESQSSFNLSVELNPERDIYLRDSANADRIMLDRNGDPKKQPGKVDAYRFMTFYLEPSQQNFERFYTSVVDPIWLAQSKDPSAAALRQARNTAQKPPCWRIFHRVTYVSRVLPEIPSAAEPLSDLEQTLTTLPDLNSNYELIQKLDPFVRDRKDSLGELEAAIDAVLSNYLPELLIHKAEIVRFMRDYYGLNS